MIPQMMEIVTGVLSKEREKSRIQVEAIIDSELNYLFTNNTTYKNKNSEVSQSAMQGGNDQMQM